MSLRDEVNPILWTAGWHAKVTVAATTIAGAAVGYAIDSAFLLGFIGFFIGPPLWFFAGRPHVNDNYRDVLDAYHTMVNKQTDEILSLAQDDDPEMFQYDTTHGSKAFRSPSITYRTNTLVVTDHSLIVHDDAKLAMPDLSTDIGDSTEEFFYDSISSVDYNSDTEQFYVKLTDGNQQSWPSERKPKDCLDELQARLREYKRQAA